MLRAGGLGVRYNPGMRTTHTCGTAKVSEFGGHALSWTPPKVGRDVLYLSPDAVLDGSKAIRGGIPVCFPWFGPLPDARDAPSHGWCRTQRWTREGPAFRLEHDGWTVRLEVEAGEALTLKFEAINRHPHARTPELALHAYFMVSDIESVSVEGLEGRPFFDQLKPAVHPRPVEDRAQIHIDAEVDRVYGQAAEGEPKPVCLLDPGFGTRLMIRTDLPSTVLWNPWVEKSRRLSDLPNDAYRRFVCIESGVVGPDVMEVGPGETFSGTVTYDIGPA